MSWYRRSWKYYVWHGVGFMLFMAAFAPEILAESGRPRLLTLAYFTVAFAVWMFLFDRVIGGSLVKRFFEKKLEEKRAVETDARERTER